VSIASLVELRRRTLGDVGAGGADREARNTRMKAIEQRLVEAIERMDWDMVLRKVWRPAFYLRVSTDGQTVENQRLPLRRQRPTKPRAARRRSIITLTMAGSCELPVTCVSHGPAFVRQEPGHKPASVRPAGSFCCEG
jgi:hypothetical protein